MRPTSEVKVKVRYQLRNRARRKEGAVRRQAERAQRSALDQLKRLDALQREHPEWRAVAERARLEAQIRNQKRVA